MVARPRWKRRKQARPAELLEHALICFAERGFDATTLDEIARRAGVTKGTIYHYFTSKDDLLDHLVSELALPAIQSLAAVAAGGGTAAERLDAVMRRHWHLLSATSIRLIPRLIVGEVHRHPEMIGRLFEAVGRHIFGIYIETVAGGIASGVFRLVDPGQAAQLIVLPMISRSLIGGAGPINELLGNPDAFIDAHCEAMRCWLLAGKGSE